MAARNFVIDEMLRAEHPNFSHRSARALRRRFRWKGQAMATFEPYFFRVRSDHQAALGAFRRLYVFAESQKDPALKAIAILKAIQKLEQLHDEEAVQEESWPITLPDWVRRGFWDALQVLVKKSPGKSGKKRLGSFKQLSSKVMSDYSLWASVKQYQEQHGVNRTPAVEAVGMKGKKDTTRTVWRAMKRIDETIKAANAFAVVDDAGAPLPYVEARDLIPTQKFKLLMDCFA